MFVVGEQWNREAGESREPNRITMPVSFYPSSTISLNNDIVTYANGVSFVKGLYLPVYKNVIKLIRCFCVMYVVENKVKLFVSISQLLYENTLIFMTSKS